MPPSPPARRAARCATWIRTKDSICRVSAEKLGIDQPKVSALANYNLDGFSVERLMTFLTALEQDGKIVIGKKPRSRRLAKRWRQNRS
jgi:predicted XRE-type DNA-binding protein